MQAIEFKDAVATHDQLLEDALYRVISRRPSTVRELQLIVGGNRQTILSNLKRLMRHDPTIQVLGRRPVKFFGVRDHGTGRKPRTPPGGIPGQTFGRR